MINRLNQNQGVIAIISIVVSIIGFFVTNGNINNFSQKQKAGDKSKNTQIGNIINNKEHE